MKLNRMGTALVSAGLAAAATLVLPAAGAMAVPPGVPALPAEPAASLGMLPATGTGETTWNFTGPAQLYCPGSGSPDGYQLNSFMVPVDADPGQLLWNTGIPQVYAGAPTGFYESLYGPGFNQLGTFPVDSTEFPEGSGQYLALSGFPPASFAIDASYAPTGVYEIGFACVAGAETGRYWSTIVQFTEGVDPADITFTQGLPTSAPAAPNVTAAQSGPGEVTATWNEPEANPEVDDYDVTLYQGATVIGSPQIGVAALTATFTGVPNGTGYTVEVVANNSEGTGTGTSPSFAVTAGAQGAPNLTVTQGADAGELVASWSVPSGVAPSGYELTVATDAALTSHVAGSPFDLPAGTTSHELTGLTAGTTYYFQVVATYTDPSAVATPSAVVTGAPASADSLQQVIQVERPAGALILTQRCGVNNLLEAEPADAGFPGFPAVEEIAATANQVGESPDPIGTPAVDTDPEFPDYPFAIPDVPTRCYIDLGPAELLTSGDLAGQYYAADGALNEVTIVETRQEDQGWTVTGSIPSLTNGGADPDDTFTGDLVGWTPVVSSTSEPVGTSTYDQVVTAGDPVVPGTANGMSNAAGQVLAHAEADEGIGIAVLDARVKVLIPVENNNGVYTGTLSINAV